MTPTQIFLLQLMGAMAVLYLGRFDEQAKMVLKFGFPATTEWMLLYSLAICTNYLSTSLVGKSKKRDVASVHIFMYILFLLFWSLCCIDVAGEFALFLYHMKHPDKEVYFTYKIVVEGLFCFVVVFLSNLLVVGENDLDELPAAFPPTAPSTTFSTGGSAFPFCAPLPAPQGGNVGHPFNFGDTPNRTMRQRRRR